MSFYTTCYYKQAYTNPRQKKKSYVIRCRKLQTRYRTTRVTAIPPRFTASVAPGYSRTLSGQVLWLFIVFYLFSKQLKKSRKVHLDRLYWLNTVEVFVPQTPAIDGIAFRSEFQEIIKHKNENKRRVQNSIFIFIANKTFKRKSCTTVVVNACLTKQAPCVPTGGRVKTQSVFRTFQFY